MQLDALIPYVVGFGLVLLRCSGMVFAVPTVGGDAVPLSVRGAIAVIFTLAMSSVVGPQHVTDPLQLVVAGLGEVLMGLAMGLVIRVVLSIAEMAGELAGMQIGLSFIQLVDPLTRETTAMTGQLVGTLAILAFLAIDGHHMMLGGLWASLEQAPVGTVLPRVAAAQTLLGVLSAAFASAVRIAAPVIVALLLTNGALGLLSRAAPQLQLFVLSFGVTVGVGMFVLSESIPSALSIFGQQLRRLPEYLAVVTGG